SAFRGWRKVPGSRGSRPPSGWRGGSSAWFARRDKRSCSAVRSFRCLPNEANRASLLEFRSQAANEAELRLKIDVVRQLQVLDESGRLHVVGMRQHEFLVLRRTLDLLAQLACPQRPVDQRHGHGLALAMTEAQTIAAREARRLRGRATKLVDHLAFGHRDASERHGEADLLWLELELDLAESDLAGERMVAAVAALGRVAERQQQSLVAAREILQADVSRGRKIQRIVHEIADRPIGCGRRRSFDQILASQ